MWNTPGRRWEKPLDDRMAMSGLGGWDSGGQPALFCYSFSKYRLMKEQLRELVISDTM